MKRHPILLTFLVASAYAISGRMGLFFAIPPGFASAIFPPSGIALGAFLVFGNRASWGVWLGSMAMNLWVALTLPSSPTLITALWTSSLVGLGAVIQAWVGSRLIQHFTGYPDPLVREKDVFQFLGLGVLSCVVNATSGVAVLWVADLISPASMLASWWTWWLGDALGVIVLTPLVTLWADNRVANRLGRRRTVTVPLLVAFTLTTFFYFYASRSEQESMKSDFKRQAGNVTAAVEQALQGYLDLLHSEASLFTTIPELTAEQFHHFSRSLMEKNPGLYALSWNTIVHAKDREDFEDEFGRKITELSPDGRLRPARWRPYYVVVQYTEPPQLNEPALGLDSASESARRDAMETSSKTRQAVISRRVQLVKQPANEPGLVIFEPVFDLNDTKKLRGYVAAVIHIGRVVDTAVRPLLPLGMEFTLLAEEEPQPLHTSDGHSLSFPIWEKREMNIAGRRLNLSFAAAPLFQTSGRRWGAWALLVSGLMFIGLLGALLLIITGRKQLIEKTVDEKTELVRLLQVVAAAANRASGLSEVLKLCLDEVCSVTKWPVGHVYLLDPKRKDLLVSSGIWHLPAGDRYRKFFDVTSVTAMPKGVGLPGRILENGQAVWISDVARDGNLPRTELARDLGIRAGLGFPIYVDDEVTGVLEFFSPETVEPDPSLLEVMEHLGAQLGQVYKRLRAEEELRSSDTRHRLIVNTAFDAFIGIDEQGLVTDWNTQAEVLFGWTRTEVLGRPIAETIVPHRFREEHNLGFSRFLNTGYGPILNKRIEITGLRKDGAEIPIELTVSPAKFGGHFIFNAFIHDITERKRAETALRRAKEELEEKVLQRTQELLEKSERLAASNAELERFAFIASHDLQEPLRMVITYIQFLEKRNADKLDPVDREFMAFAVDGALRMRALIEDLLSFARIEKAERPKERVDFRELVEEAKLNLIGALNETGAQVTVGELPSLHGDAVQMVQLFQNLMGNALKYRSERRPEIHIASERRDGRWLFSVRDNGIGIARDYWEKIFVVFQRLHSDRKKYPGTGIGLALCKRIVERHHGKIWVESVLGEGSTFYFTLPVEAEASIEKKPHVQIGEKLPPNEIST